VSNLILLVFGTGVAVGLWAPGVIAWIMIRGEKPLNANLSLDELLEQTLGPQPAPKRRGSRAR
jgi:hypothetical protein